MKTIFKSCLSLSMLLIGITSAAAQSTTTDSTMTKITQERAFYETLGKIVGTDEVLNDDSKIFYDYIQPIQPKSKLKEFQDQKHVWLISNIDSKESVEAMKDIKEFISTKSF